LAGGAGCGRIFVGGAGGGSTFVGGTGGGSTFDGICGAGMTLAGGRGVWAWAVAERQAAAARKPKSRRSFMGVVSKRSDILPNRDPAGPARPPSATVCTSILDARDCNLWVIWDFFAFDWNLSAHPE
jgi:hypothetical protein